MFDFQHKNSFDEPFPIKPNYGELVPQFTDPQGNNGIYGQRKNSFFDLMKPTFTVNGDRHHESTFGR